MANMKLPNLPSENEIDDFLSKVDEIGSVLKGLNSKDEEDIEKYMSKANHLIKDAEEKKDEIQLNDPEDKDLPKTRIGFSKTNINKDAYKNDPDPDMADLTGPSLPVDGAMDQKAFMAAMEADAIERSERKKKRDKIANGFKEEGNAEFKQGNYSKALDFYDKAMEQAKDNLAIYTNRAQCKIKLGMFTDALTDCDWALRLTPSCLKALVHQGHAYLCLKEYEKARDSYKQILEINSQKEAMVNEYLAAVTRAEQAALEEAKALQSFDEGKEVATGVVELLARLNREGQLPLYYSGGFRAITQLLTDNEAQTLFRTNDGLHLPKTHPILNKCLSSPAMGKLLMVERDLISAALDMLEAASKDNETSQQQLLSNLDFPSQLLSILDAQFNGQGRLLKTSCVNLLHRISLTQAGRAAIVGKFDLPHLISSLFMLMTKKSPYAETAAAFLNNMALEKRLKAAIRDSIEERILPAFESLLTSNKTPPPIIALASSTFTNLAADLKIRSKMSCRVSLWNAMSNVLLSLVDDKLCSSLESVLGLLVNVSTGLTSSQVFQESNTIHESCFRVVVTRDEDWMLPAAVTRALVILSNILPHCERGLSWMSCKDRVLVLMELIQDEVIYTNKKAALKCLTALTQNDESVVDIVAENKGTSLLLKLLQNEKPKPDGVENQPSEEDLEIILGNTTLCMSHLCSRSDVCAKLTKTNIIQRLLVLARDGRKAALQSNAAILIGKLVKGDSRHLERLRELHGIEILHQCMKHIK